MGYLVVELREDRSFIGWAHLRPDSHDPEWAEIGYRLRRSHWGRGLATEVALALMTHAFDTLGYSTVTARTMPANIASRRVMEKCGLRCVGESQFLERDFGVFKWPASPALFYMGRKT
jgi:RimJ/RimL family protein N-acetyltransferase